MARRMEAELLPERILYKAPLNGELVAAEGERHDIAKLMMSTPPLGYHYPENKDCRCTFGEDRRLIHHRVECPVKSIPMPRMLEILTGKTHGAFVPSAPHVTKSEHHRHDVIYSQGAQSMPGVFFICDGRVKLSRKNSQGLMDNMQSKLFVVGAFPSVSDEENALRKPKSSEKEWELGILGPGNFIGLGGLKETSYADTARAHMFAKLIFIPADVLSGRLHDVKNAILQVLGDAALSRQRQFERVTALFQPQECADGEKKDYGVPAKRKKLDTGLLNVKPSVVRAHGEKRYQRCRGSDVAFAGPYGFRPGEVPQFNPDLLAPRRDRTAFQFLKMQTSFSRPKEPGTAELGLPPKCQIPGTRVARLYDRLWDNCTLNTWNTLLDMQVLPEHDVASQDNGVHQIRQVSSPMERKLEEAREHNTDNAQQHQGLVTNVPTLDLYMASLPWDEGERPVTEPGRSRSARVKREGISITNLRDTPNDPVSGAETTQRRPATSRPHAPPKSLEQMSKRFDFPLPRSSEAARRAIAWSGPPSRWVVHKYPMPLEHPCA